MNGAAKEDQPLSKPINNLQVDAAPEILDSDN